MRARTAVTLLLPLGLTSVAACESADPTEPPVTTIAERPSVRIEGPDVIVEMGTYTWYAVTDDEIEPESWEWEVRWSDTDDLAIINGGRELELEVDPIRGRLEIRLRVLAKGQWVTALAAVETCGFEVDLDDQGDRIVRECPLEKH